MNPGAGDNGKRDGMERAGRHADPHWWQCMLESLHAVALTLPYFNTDAVVQYCRTHYPNASTHERRAIGPLMASGARLGYCIIVRGDWNPSQQAQCHARPKQTWYSLLYRGPLAVPRPRRRRLLDPRQLGLWDQ